MLEVVPLGGLGEFGMNMLALTWGETTIVIDAGVMFPDPELLGVDRILDMCRTVLNVTGDMVTAAVVDRVERRRHG